MQADFAHKLEHFCGDRLALGLELGKIQLRRRRFILGPQPAAIGQARVAAPARSAFQALAPLLVVAVEGTSAGAGAKHRMHAFSCDQGARNDNAGATL
jgi:hypothetical protein